MVSVILLMKTPAIDWQYITLGRVYSSHLLFMLIPVLWLWITRRDLGEYGIKFRGFTVEWQTAMGVYLPVALSGVVLGFVAYDTLFGGLIMALVQIGLLFWIARIMNTKPDPKSGMVTVGLSVALFGVYGVLQTTLPTVSGAIFGFIFYFFFVGFGEEILYRGYILTRLNEAFGRPNHFKGLNWGWGALIAAALFGFSHVLNGWNMITGEFTPMWGWGLWTLFGALVFTYIRERTGSIVPGAIAPGLPQALLSLFISWI